MDRSAPPQPRRPADRGFSLVELLVAMLVLGVLAAVAIPTFVQARRSSADRTATASARTVTLAAARFVTDPRALAAATPAVLGARLTGTNVVAAATPSTGPGQVSMASSSTRVWAVARGADQRCQWSSVGADGRTVSGTVELPACSAAALQGATAVLDAPGLVGFWRLGEPQGAATAYDLSGNGRHGTYTGTRTADASGAVTGDGDGSSSFPGGTNGTGGAVRLPSMEVDFSRGVTLAGWARPTGTPGYFERILELGNGPSSDNLLLARHGTGPHVVGEIFRVGAGGHTFTSGAAALVTGTWQHLAMTWDAGGTMVLYRNGVEVRRVTGYPQVPRNVLRSQNFIGRSTWVADPDWRGGLDDVAVWNRALNPAELLAIAAPTRPGPGTLPVSAGLRLWLDADDLDGDGTAAGLREAGQTNGAVTTWRDRSGNGCDAARPTTSPDAPQLAVRGANGRSTVRFTLDGAADFLEVTCPTVRALGAQSRTVIAVARANRTGGGSEEVLGAIVSGGGHTLHFGSDAGTTVPVRVAHQQNRNDATTLLWAQRPGYRAGALAVVGGTVGSSGGTVTLQTLLDGEASGTSGPGAAFASDSAVRIGRFSVSGPGGSQLDGDIAEVLVFDRVLGDADRQAVEAYLRAKWLTPAGPTPPAPLLAWFDAGDLDGDSVREGAAEQGVDTGTVARWADRSGNRRDVLATGAARPAFVVAGQGGLPVVRFDGVDDVMTSAVGPSAAGGPSTIVAVLRTRRVHPAAGWGNPVSLGWGGGCAGVIVTASARAQHDGCGEGLVNLGPDTRTWRVVTVRYTGTTVAGAQVFVDGAPVLTASGSAAVGAWTQVQLGARDVSLQRLWGGDLAEVRVYGAALSDTARIAVERELTAAWGTTPTLPVTAGLQLWLDGDDLDGDGRVEGTAEAVLSGGTVTQWNDRSGNGRHALVPTGSPMPPTGSTAGRTTVQFAGPTQGHVLSSATTLPTGTMLVVARYAGAVPVPRYDGIFTAGAEWGGDEDDIAFTLHVGTAAALWNDNLFGGGQRIDGVPRVSFSHGTGANGWHLFSGSPRTGARTSWPGFTVGRDRSLTDRPLTGEVAEVITYDRRLTATELQQVEAYLALKWGLTLG